MSDQRPDIARLPVASPIPWETGQWTRPPVEVLAAGSALVVEAAEGSDAWRDTYYGFVHDSAHALLVEARPPIAYEVSFRLDFTRTYDQAGLMVSAGPTAWIKAGVEVTDGVPHAGAVVTGPTGSDWSVAPVPSWSSSVVTVRASLDRDAVILRARAYDGPWQFLRLAPLPAGPLRIGPFVCAPEGPGLRVQLTRFAAGLPDPRLHLEEEST